MRNNVLLAIIKDYACAWLTIHEYGSRANILGNGKVIYTTQKQVRLSLNQLIPKETNALDKAAYAKLKFGFGFFMEDFAQVLLQYFYFEKYLMVMVAII